MLATSTRGVAQVKYEKESRLNEKDIPERAKRFVDTLQTEARVRWYLEEGLEGTTVEAKFSYKGFKHSIEFDTLGYVEDVEIEVPWSLIPEVARKAINQSLIKECSHHKIRKVQLQYTGPPHSLIAKIQNENTLLPYILKYEIIARCRTSEDLALYEYLFSDDGQKLRRSKIVFKNSSNLEY